MMQCRVDFHPFSLDVSSYVSLDYLQSMTSFLPACLPVGLTNSAPLCLHAAQCLRCSTLLSRLPDSGALKLTRTPKENFKSEYGWGRSREKLSRGLSRSNRNVHSHIHVTVTSLCFCMLFLALPCMPPYRWVANNNIITITIAIATAISITIITIQ